MYVGYGAMLELISRQLEEKIGREELQQRIRRKIEDRELLFKQLQEEIGNEELRKKIHEESYRNRIGYLSDLGATLLIAKDLDVELHFYCPNCGKRNQIASHQCEKCGLKLPDIEWLTLQPLSFFDGFREGIFTSFDDCMRWIRSKGFSDSFLKSFEKRAGGSKGFSDSFLKSFEKQFGEYPTLNVDAWQAAFNDTLEPTLESMERL